jgi:hypothetical protein
MVMKSWRHQHDLMDGWMDRSSSVSIFHLVSTMLALYITCSESLDITSQSSIFYLLGVACISSCILIPGMFTHRTAAPTFSLSKALLIVLNSSFIQSAML